jgi:4-amino-4-deoxy-L-arabinose transferase-like glycosyltransferase
VSAGPAPSADTHTTRFEWKRGDIVFPLALAAIHAVLWWWANHREGVWLQVPATDQSHDLRTAWALWRALGAGNLSLLIEGWVHGSPVHTPFVPFVSGALMLVLGESRQAAESVLPLATAVWLISTYAVIARLYDRSTARKVTALVGAFPVFLIYSRTYLFEHPLAAVVAAACWALLASDGFARTGPTVLFGVLAGITALTRGGAPVYLVGPVIVMLASVRREAGWPRRLAKCALAVLIAGALAATWYVPNLVQFVGYLYRATYGEESGLRAGAGGPFSLANAQYYLIWIIAQGPGVPMAVVALLAWMVALTSGGARIIGLVGRALTTVFAVDFLLLLVAAQHETARYFQPLMPLIALAVVQAVDAIQQTAVRRAFAAAVVILALHHVLALSLIWRFGPQDVAPFALGFPLWDHRTNFNSLVNYYALRTPRDDFKIPETIAALDTLHLPVGAVIGTIGTPHAFYHPNGLQLAAEQNQRPWRFAWSLDPRDPRSAAGAEAAGADAVLLRFGGPTSVELAQVARALPALFDPVRRRFDPAESPLELGDGSRVMIFRRRAPGAFTSALASVPSAPATGSTWVVRSPFPSAVAQNPDGTFSIRTHPTRPSTGTATRISLAGTNLDGARITGRIRFYDPRCAGVEIVAVAEGMGRQEAVLGTFSPKENGAPLRAKLPRADGEPLALDIRGPHANPENIDFCTVGLEDLRVAAGP